MHTEHDQEIHPKVSNLGITQMVQIIPKAPPTRQPATRRTPLRIVAPVLPRAMSGV
jgi:hypothetical protein